MQLAQRPGGAYALKANPHFQQTRVSAIELFVDLQFSSRRNLPKAKSQKCYSFHAMSELPADIGLAINLCLVHWPSSERLRRAKLCHH